MELSRLPSTKRCRRRASATPKRSGNGSGFVKEVPADEVAEPARALMLTLRAEDESVAGERQEDEVVF